MFKAKRTRTFLGLAVIVCVVYLVWHYMGAKDTGIGKFVERIVRDPAQVFSGGIVADLPGTSGASPSGMAPVVLSGAGTLERGTVTKGWGTFSGGMLPP